MLSLTTLLAALVASASLVHAHPGASREEIQAEILAQSEYVANLENTNLYHCEKKLNKRDGSSASELETIARRRMEKVSMLRRELNLREDGNYHKFKRQAPAGGPGFPKGGFPPPPWGGPFEVPRVASISHKSNLTIANPSQADWALLGQNKSVILSPESTEGPFYVRGEHVRKDVRDGQKGIDLYMDIQVVDVNTCEALKDTAVEIWAANATGVYSGIVSFMNGNPADKANLQNQAMRGVQITGNDGSVDFKTIFPGHYTGRAIHIHLATHLGVTKNSNDTISGGTTAHVGQLYLDQDLIEAVSATPPYTTNRMQRTLNSKDRLLAVSAANGADPIMEYVLLGNDIKQGIFAWINFGVDSKKKVSIRPAAICTSEGCKANPAALFGPPGGFGQGGPPPKGSPPPNSGSTPKSPAN